MARFQIEYLENGSIMNTLYFDGVGYHYFMSEDEEKGWFASDKPVFSHQVKERFPDLYSEEVLDLIDEISYDTDSEDLRDILMELSYHE